MNFFSITTCSRFEFFTRAPREGRSFFFDSFSDARDQAVFVG